MLCCSVSGQEAESADGNLPSGEDGEECSALSESLSRLRSPSVMEVREKGYERLKEELAKAQRVHKHTHTNTHGEFDVCVCVSTCMSLHARACVCVYISCTQWS